MSTAYDSTVPADIPAGADVVLWYKDGKYAWSGADLARFSPHALKAPITVLGTVGVQIIDCEPGCVWPVSRAAALAHATLVSGTRPTVYANEATWPAVDAALKAVGIGRGVNCDGWLALYDGVANVPAGFVAKQYISHNTHPVYDLSVTNGVWPAFVAPPKPPEPPMPLSKPAVTILVSPTGLGYWVAASDGGIFAYGVPFFGSLGGDKLAAPIVGGGVTPTGKGYYLVGSDGGVFCFGDAVFHGTPAGVPLGSLLRKILPVKPTVKPGWFPATYGDGNRALATV